MNRRLIGLVLAILLAAGGTFVLVSYVRGAEDRALAGEQSVEVLVVDRPIAKGTAAASIVAPHSTTIPETEDPPER